MRRHLGEAIPLLCRQLLATAISGGRCLEPLSLSLAGTPGPSHTPSFLSSRTLFCLVVAIHHRTSLRRRLVRCLTTRAKPSQAQASPSARGTPLPCRLTQDNRSRPRLLTRPSASSTIDPPLRPFTLTLNRGEPHRRRKGPHVKSVSLMTVVSSQSSFVDSI